MNLSSQEVVRQIEAVLARWNQSVNRVSFDASGVSDSVLGEAAASISHAIERFSPPGSAFRERALETLQKHSPHTLHIGVPILYGILSALLDAYRNDYLTAIEELVHADVYSDFMEMAQYLIQEGYKDAAAVMVGGVLEENLRKLTLRNNLPITDQAGKARKASSLNEDLAKCAYDKLTQKSVTAWLDLRNNAAHGHYTEYDKAQVALMFSGVQDFLNRYRA